LHQTVDGGAVLFRLLVGAPFQSGRTGADQ
jgi:hypothetical protein